MLNGGGIQGDEKLFRICNMSSLLESICAYLRPVQQRQFKWNGFRRVECTDSRRQHYGDEDGHGRGFNRADKRDRHVQHP